MPSASERYYYNREEEPRCWVTQTISSYSVGNTLFSLAIIELTEKQFEKPTLSVIHGEIYWPGKTSFRFDRPS